MEWTLNRKPSLAAIYWRGLTARKAGVNAQLQLPAMAIHLPAVTIRRKHLQRYRQICGFSDESVLPATYIQVLGFPLKMAMLTHRQFPIPLLGLIHIKNTIEIRQALTADDVLDFTVRISGQRAVEKGLEFDTVTEVRRVGAAEVVWRCVATMLHRCPGPMTAADKQKAVDKQNPVDKQKIRPSPMDSNVSFWNLPANLGRRYGRVSTDLNPIHLSLLTARLFGFRRAIAHGMWSKARALASLEGQLPACPWQVTVKFKTPVFLPARARFAWQRQDSKAIEFELWDRHGEKPHLSGTIVSSSETAETTETTGS